VQWAIIDTDIYIGHWEQGLYAELLATVQQAFIVRHSAVALSKLRRGARTRPGSGGMAGPRRPAGFVTTLVRAGLLRRQGDQLAAAYLVPSPGLLDIGLRLHDAGLDIETGADAAALIRHSMRRAAAKLVKHFARRSGRGFARSRSAGDVGEALTALRSFGAEAVRLVFAQEIERALRTAMEKGAIPAPQRRA